MQALEDPVVLEVSENFIRTTIGEALMELSYPKHADSKETLYMVLEDLRKGLDDGVDRTSLL